MAAEEGGKKGRKGRKDEMVLLTDTKNALG